MKALALKEKEINNAETKKLKKKNTVVELKINIFFYRRKFFFVGFRERKNWIFIFLMMSE